MVNETFPQLVTIGQQLLSSFPSSSSTPSNASASQDVPTILHFILKAYRGSIILQLSKHQQSHESLVAWGNLFFQVINLRVEGVEMGIPESEEEREKCEWWKAKKWALGCLHRLFHRWVGLGDFLFFFF